MIAALAATATAFSGPAQPLADSLAARIVHKDGLTHVPLVRKAKTVQEHAAMKAWREQASAQNSTIMIKNFQDSEYFGPISMGALMRLRSPVPSPPRLLAARDPRRHPGAELPSHLRHRELQPVGALEQVPRHPLEGLQEPLQVRREQELHVHGQRY